MMTNGNKAPLFVIGNPRSGTSLLRLILTCHSKIIIPPECGFMLWLKVDYGDWSLSDVNSPRLNNFIRDLLCCKKFKTWSLDYDVINDEIIKTKPSTYAELCKCIYILYGKNKYKRISLWGDKNNYYINCLEDLAELYPEAIFLHIIRDGRDVACSYIDVMKSNPKSIYAPNLRCDIEGIASEWVGNIERIDEFMKLLTADKGMTIKYESLVQEPDLTFNKVCKWLGLEFESQMLNFYQINKKEQLEPTLTMEWKGKTMQPIDSEGVGRFEKVFCSEELTRFEKIAFFTLSRFSYL